MIINFKIVIKKFLDLFCFLKSEVFYIYKLFKIIIVDKHKNFRLTAFYIMTASFKCFKNR